MLKHTLSLTHALRDDVRCDSGVAEGSEISIHYDPLICKLVTHGATREEASEKMQKVRGACVCVRTMIMNEI
jgi:acetyl/propionyl-CoA carboxylase alpha subunit